MKGRYSPSREAVKKRLGEGVGLHEASGWRGYRTEGDVIHMGARLYHYPTARFLSADPLGHASDMSLYSYANNDPVNGVDPTGRHSSGLTSGISGFNPTSSSFYSQGFINSGYFLPAASYNSVQPYTSYNVSSGNFITNMIMNTVDYVYEMTRGHSALTNLNLGGGYILSILSGDIFDRQTDFVTGARATSVNGILVDQKSGLELSQSVSSAINRPTNHVVNNSHWFGIGDVIQVVGTQLGAIDITAIRAVQSIRANNGGVVVAHSQGTMIVNRALDLLSQEVKRNIDFVGVGGQTAINTDRGLNSAVNVWHNSDPVTWAQVIPSTSEGNYYQSPIVTFGEGGFSVGAHSFNDVYMPYLKEHIFPNLPK
ncbi:MAG: RHS repeat-associated core domain-containing protein [Methylacidiphilales bacterium]|nr:RHS repeat-associated core domain-containing protein [Candidatus Methylacidiphilales bacterium]